jgi:hypothetical protein
MVYRSRCDCIRSYKNCVCWCDICDGQMNKCRGSCYHIELNAIFCRKNKFYWISRIVDNDIYYKECFKYDIVNDCFKIAKIEGSKERKTNRYTFRMNQLLDINEIFYRENQIHF